VREYFVIFVVAGAITYFSTPFVRAVAVATNAFTPVRERDVHSTPTPRLGGVAIFLGFAAAGLVARELPYLKGVYSSGQISGVIMGAAFGRIVTTLVGMVETRVRLAVVELEEEKANIIQMLLMLGLTMLFTAFGLMSLMVLIIWAVDAQYRLMAIAITTGVLFLLALIFGLWTLRKSRQSTLLRHTRKELANDRDLLEDNR